MAAASDLTSDQLDEIRRALDAPDASDEELRARIMRLNLAGWRLVSAPDLDAELARVLRMATHTLASEMQAIARRFDQSPDLELVTTASPQVRDDLLTRWLEDRS